MHCSNCGTQLGNGQGFCPSCGAKVNIANNSGDFSNSGYVSSSASHSVNVNEPSDIGFGRNMEQDLNQFGMNNPYENRGNIVSNEMTTNQVNGEINIPMENQMNIPEGMMNMPEDNGKKKFPWFLVASVLVVVIVFGVFLLPIFTKDTLKTYDAEDYSLTYNANWSAVEDKGEMVLYYSDNDSRFILNGISSFESLKFEINDENDKKILYGAFYDAWSTVDGGELTGGTETFLLLENNSIYARVDYEMTNSDYVGAFYVVISEEYDKVISFVSYCVEDNWEEIDLDIVEMLNSMTYKGESVSEKEAKKYALFDEGEAKDYASIGYMNYKIPDCWTYDEARTASVDYKSYIFEFKDDASLLDVKAITPYNSVTKQFGTSYENMKNAVLNSYGALKEESTKTINGKVWYVMVTPDYNIGQDSFHNEIYFTLSTNNTNLYYVEAYISNDSTAAKDKYMNDSIEYILNSAVLHKVNE